MTSSFEVQFTAEAVVTHADGTTDADEIVDAENTADDNQED